MSDENERPVKKLRGALRVVRLFGIDVHVHWSWLLVAVLQVWLREGVNTSVAWNVVVYVCLFLIVLLHEFGHALACRSVGGSAENILLWPLGGVAYVRPPPRPGATLWSLAAGPLVNVALLPVTIGLLVAATTIAPESEFQDFAWAMAVINALVLVFNLLPIYPLDGGQMLRSLLWYFIGPHKSLIVATAIGLLGAGAGLILALVYSQYWLALIAGFSVLSSRSGLRVARARAALARQTRRVGVACPECRESPPRGACWPCPNCSTPYDAFEFDGACPRCKGVARAAGCPFCGASIPMPGAEGPILDVSAHVEDAADRRQSPPSPEY